MRAMPVAASATRAGRIIRRHRRIDRCRRGGNSAAGRTIRTTIRSAGASSYMSLRTTRMPEETLKVHRLAAVLPEQLLSEASRHRDAVVPADQRTVMRCLGDDLAALVHDVSHSRIALLGSTSAVERATRGLHVRSYARNGAQPVRPCAGRRALQSTSCALGG